ncbi:hypothetical protein [Lactiplantibacillus carotarum]|uniref:hypothetical protein n=1 Tax=Lactiplantibacillus carotarum TaxID=2993456 RepID=UPI00298F0116|nr:hypothetical protein [Lactiplantibacillus carotarum]
MDDLNEIQMMFQAVDGRKTVRYPLPETIDELGLKRDQRQVSQLLRRLDSEYDADIQAMVEYLIALQRLLFNRGLSQITPESMADLIAIALPAGKMADEEIQMMASLAGYVVHVLAEQNIIQGADTDERYLATVEKVRPDLTSDIPVDTETVTPDNYFAQMVSAGFFECDPVVLWDENQTPFFVQPSSAGVDFNEFIAQIAAKHDPLQLLAAYRLFDGEDYGYQKILYADQPRNGQLIVDDSELGFRLSLVWIRLNTLRSEAVLAELKVYHQFLRFCLDHELLTAQRYAKLLKVGNQVAIMCTLTAAGDFSLWNTNETEGKRLADQIFTKPNYTLNLKQARALFATRGYTPTEDSSQIPTTSPLILAKPLDQHQLELELKRADKNLTGLNEKIATQDFADLPLYAGFVRDLHQKMVQDYHRRLNRWTQQSLCECLCTLFQENDWVASHPTILRYLQVYLFYVADTGAVKNDESLFDGIYLAETDYLRISENFLAEQR